MGNELTKYHQLLNQEGIYPETYLRRNHVMYPLVCYVNNIICLYICENYTPIPLFINRAYTHLIQYSSNDVDHRAANLSKKYQQLVMEYLSEMAKFLSAQDINPSYKNQIPIELFKSVL
jgi:hypothetical protein